MKLTDKSAGQAPEDPRAAGSGPSIILVRTQLGENAGSVARAMHNFELFDLRIVAPKFGWPNAKAVAAASGAAGILNDMLIAPDMTTAIDDCHHLYATTARAREMDKPVVTPREAMEQARAQIDAGRKVGFIFGPERTGLENDELVLADSIVSIPVNPKFWSLNLAQAVLLCAYEWKLAGNTAPAAPAHNPAPPASKGDLARLLDELITRLEDSGFFRSADRKDSLALTIRGMFERRQLTSPEVHLLHGIFKELNRRRDQG